MEQLRGLLLLFLGVQLLLMGAFLYQNHNRHSLASFLHILIRDGPTVGEELPLLVSVSSAGTSSQDVYANLSQIHSVDVSEEHLPSCPLISPYINGPLRVTIPENLTMEQVLEKNPQVELGGQYWPPDCWTRHHTAVVRQQLHYAVYVVNQVHNTAFNRGKLCNVEFWEAMQEEEWDCVFFHDVNPLPEDDCNLYICDIYPPHVSVATDKFNYKINSFPNSYWGWDHEDHDITARLQLSGMLLSRPHRLFGCYHMLEGQDPSHQQSPQRLLSKELQPPYTSLTVDINFPTSQP
ncbi:hypothetical protein GH733_017201 [Mirounga leonina]|nr:hypothetical protein GH733_017201 [Mirounga leonina]